MKRDWARLLTIGGSIMVIQSLFWEYARMKPDNNYLVTPWSARGFDSIHGTVFAVIGASLLIAALIIGSQFTRTSRNSLIAVAGVVVAAFIIALVFAGGEDVTIGGDSLGGIVFGLVFGYTLYLAASRVVERIYGEKSSAAGWLQGGTGALAMFAFIAVGFVIISTVLGEAATIPAPLAVLLVVALIGGLVSLMRQVAMAANRMLIATSIVAGTAIGMSGAAVRSTLVRLQGEGGNIPGQYRDTQVTWGYFLANIGVVLFFMGAVMLWARRRDIVQAQQRAAKQRAAAEESAAELAAAG